MREETGVVVKVWVRIPDLVKLKFGEKVDPVPPGSAQSSEVQIPLEELTAVGSSIQLLKQREPRAPIKPTLGAA